MFGFLVTAALIIMLVFALKTRQKIQSYGKSNIFWKKVKLAEDVAPPQDVEAWVSHYKMRVGFGKMGRVRVRCVTNLQMDYLKNTKIFITHLVTTTKV